MLHLFRSAKKIVLVILFSCSLFKNANAWGPEGHAIVGRIAMQFVSNDVRQNILGILGNMSIDTAANWMDIVRSNPDYDFMKSWHYIDFAKEKLYAASNDENIVNRLLLTFNELKHKKTLCAEQIRTDLFILLHLMGDLHMPLHNGYDEDLGGNKRMVQYDTLKTHNLHTFWDVDIIEFGKIKDGDCLQYLTEMKKDTMQTIDFVSWMKESRGLLDGVYNFQGFTLTKEYLATNKIVVSKQLLKAGLRLALLLNKLFYSQKQLLDYKAITGNYKNGLLATKALQNTGKSVTVCERVYNIKASATITQISLGAAYPNNPLTIIVFAKNYANFPLPLEEMFRDKDICVKGKIELYKGKPQIILEKPSDVEFLK